MEAESVPGPTAGANWVYEPKWDGFQCLAIHEAGRVVLQVKSGKPPDRYCPEVVRVIAAVKPHALSSMARSSSGSMASSADASFAAPHGTSPPMGCSPGSDLQRGYTLNIDALYGRPSTAARLLALGATALLASAALTRFLTRQAEANHFPGGKVLTINGQTVHVIDEGSGPCVVLLHGNGGMVEDYEATTLIETLAKTHRVIVLDRAGFGLSSRAAGGTWTPEREAEQLAEIFARLDVRNPVLVGHSWGTMVAIALALRDPSFVKGLVLLSGYYFPTARLDVALQTPVSLPIVGPLLRHTVMPLISRMNAPLAIKQIFAPMKVPLLFSRLYSVPMASRPSQLKSVAADTVTMPANAARLSERYTELQMPVRIIAGTDDQIVSTEEQSARLHLELHNSEIQLLEGVGHMTHHARPDLVVDAVSELESLGVGHGFHVGDVATADRRVS
jgi:pimeloyl-ACP methyl ester carboxylesterase